jgi:hypothetical protein
MGWEFHAKNSSLYFLFLFVLLWIGYDEAVRIRKRQDGGVTKRVPGLVKHRFKASTSAASFHPFMPFSSPSFEDKTLVTSFHLRPDSHIFIHNHISMC